MSEHAARILVVHDVPENVRLLEAVLDERAGDRLSHADRLRVAAFRREHARTAERAVTGSTFKESHKSGCAVRT